MDDTRPVSGNFRFPVAKPHRPPLAPTEAPDAFVPLRLMLVPTGMSIDLTKPEIIVGRHSGADLRLPLADVSRRHCKLFFREGCWHIADLDSLNGVYVNDKQVPQAVLQNGDRLRLGSFTFEVNVPLAPTIMKPLPPDIRRAS
jgi:hypothetical protein